MSQERPAARTVVTPAEMFAALSQSWWALFNRVPKKESIILLQSHWALETGHGKAMWNYNLGNAKSKVGGSTDWCFFACNEILSKTSAERLQAANPDTAKITKYRSAGDCIIWFYPKHPACCFRSFPNLVEGALDHLELVHRRFSKSWPFVEAGDPGGYCHALRQQRYYTADESSYTAGVVKIFDSYTKSLAAVKINLPPPTEISRPTLLSATDFSASPLQAPKEEEESPLWSPYSMKLETSDG